MSESQTTADSPEPPLPLHTFHPPLIVPPLKPPHRQTLIFLHGRGSSARIFAPPFLSAPVESPGEPEEESQRHITTLQYALPHTRFVFPTAPRSRATVYRRSVINQWYDGSGDWEETVLGGAGETVAFLRGLLAEEAAVVGGAGRVVLGGFSQGCAAALLCLLLWESEEPLGGVVGMCGMLPMGGVLGDVLRGADDLVGEEEDDVFASTSPFDDDGDQASASPVLQALNLLREEVGLQKLGRDSESRLEHIPVFLGHGTADENVPVQYGQDASRVLQMMQYDVTFKSYQGLDHWYSTEMMSDVVRFLGQKVACFARSKQNQETTQGH
ncbi:acyl-protein thioesterase [Colletotrichum karsti]|uniref:Acyl-protein thioesterase n=1 Tax=Colletotrichum karsti TaxID=1095194 RepID=A0A9P6LKI2_9PEZI|nr:acyl-protein thioesterase [Colletotrichum karsti]KAF9876060.1 acyl-protein thioesterase [Colletotrichum karsti]